MLNNEMSAWTKAEKTTTADVTTSSQTIAKPNVMCRLSDLGWKNRCDTYDAYYKKINDYEVCVSKHINSKEWSVTLIEWDEGGRNSDEITINYDANIDWVIQLSEVLSNGT